MLLRIIATSLALLNCNSVSAQSSNDSPDRLLVHPIEREIPSTEEEELFAEWCIELVETIDPPESPYHVSRMDWGAKQTWVVDCNMKGFVSDYQVNQMLEAELGLEQQVLDNLNCMRIRNDLSYNDFSSWTIGYLKFLSVCSITERGDIEKVRNAFGVPLGWLENNPAAIDIYRWGYDVIDELPRAYLTPEEIQLRESWRESEESSNLEDREYDRSTY